jgi:ribose 5-phosphate isomerase A
MAADLSPVERAKFVAAKKAVDFVESGMRVGLGTGSTAAWMVRLLGERVRQEGLRISGVPTSSRTAALARAEGIEVVTLDEARWLDLTIDGTDEFDGELNLIKGGGGALLQEKIVATASDQMIVIADTGKEVARLGAFPLPVEVIGFGWQTSPRSTCSAARSRCAWTATGPIRRTRATASSTFTSAGSATRANSRSRSTRCRAWLKTGYS